MINDPDFSLCSLDFTYTDKQWDHDQDRRAQ